MDVFIILMDVFIVLFLPLSVLVLLLWVLSLAKGKETPGVSRRNLPREGQIIPDPRVRTFEIIDPIDRAPWRKRSKWAINNLPPTKDPIETRLREKMRVWQMLNDTIIDSEAEYWAARGNEVYDIDIVIKKNTKDDTFLFDWPKVYDVYTLKPIPSRRNPDRDMDVREWGDITEEEDARRRGVVYEVLSALNPKGVVW